LAEEYDEAQKIWGCAQAMLEALDRAFCSLMEHGAAMPATPYENRSMQQRAECVIRAVKRLCDQRGVSWVMAQEARRNTVRWSYLEQLRFARQNLETSVDLRLCIDTELPVP